MVWGSVSHGKEAIGSRVWGIWQHCIHNQCCSYSFYCYDETSWPNGKLWRFVRLTFQHCCSPLKDIRTGTQTGQDPRSRSWYRGHGGILPTDLLPIACSVHLLIEPKTKSPRTAPLTMNWALLHWSLIDKMPYSWISLRHFLRCGSFLSDHSSLSQVDTKPVSTVRKQS